MYILIYTHMNVYTRLARKAEILKNQLAPKLTSKNAYGADF